MHIVNLGVDLWIAGSTFKVLLQSYTSQEIWSGATETARLATAHVDFKQWARLHKLKQHVLISLSFFLAVRSYHRDIANNKLSIYIRNEKHQL